MDSVGYYEAIKIKFCLLEWISLSVCLSEYIIRIDCRNRVIQSEGYKIFFLNLESQILYK